MFCFENFLKCAARSTLSMLGGLGTVAAGSGLGAAVGGILKAAGVELSINTWGILLGAPVVPCMIIGTQCVARGIWSATGKDGSCLAPTYKSIPSSALTSEDLINVVNDVSSKLSPV